jgi:aldose 1-epimerase
MAITQIQNSVSLIESSFGEIDNMPISLFTFKNQNQHTISITNLGGIITKWECPDKSGTLANVVIGFSQVKHYQKHAADHFGGIIGRYANRIANAQFQIEDNIYKLSINEGNNQLHGGNNGFDQKIWDAKIIDSDSPLLELSYLSPHGEEGFPGNLNVKVSYQLTTKNELIIHYTAQTDQSTHVNLTNHSYFNLSGDFSKKIMDHSMWMNANGYLMNNEEQIPSGIIQNLNGSALDFSTPKLFQRAFEGLPMGIDHQYVLKSNNDYTFSAIVKHEASGRILNVKTTEPGIQVYTGNHLNSGIILDNKMALHPFCSFCLETQHFPDSPNQNHFPNTLLKAGEVFESKTVYQIEVNV